MARPEQTEQATPKRRSEARRKGQVARSTDLTGAATFLVGITILHMVFFSLLKTVAIGMRSNLEHAFTTNIITIHVLSLLVFRWGSTIVLPVSILLCCIMVVGIGMTIAQIGLVFSFHVIEPNITKINPLAGIKRLFSMQTTILFLKQLLKLSMVFLLIGQAMQHHIQDFVALADASPLTMISIMESLCYEIGFRFGLLLLAIGGFDYFWERRRLSESLKMTKQEVRDEHRQQEGSREAKGVFRRRQRELARRRMMAAVPTATVVVTNPTHYAVALRWIESEMEAPIVVAKGADLMAQRIRELARKHEVPLVENPPLARSMYATIPIDTPVSPTMYAAVARVIAFVYALQARPTGRTSRAVAH